MLGVVFECFGNVKLQGQSAHLFESMHRLTKSESRQGGFEVRIESEWGHKEDLQLLHQKLLPVFERLDSVNQVSCLETPV